MEKTRDWLSDLKLRFGWGQTGNQETSNTAVHTLYVTDPEEEAERQAIEDAKANPLEDVYERFAVVDTEDGEYAIWDEQTGTYYVDHEGVTEYFDDECCLLYTSRCV